MDRGIFSSMRFDSSSSKIALWIILAGTLITFAVRYITAQNFVLIGDDSVNYIATLNFIQGNDFSGTGGNRPPLIGYYLYPFTKIFGLITGTHLAAIVASVSGAGCFYLVAKRITAPVWAALGGIAYLWLPIYAETLAWGFLSILMLNVVLLAMWGWLRYAEEPSLEKAVSATALSSLVIYINQTAVPVLGCILAGFWLVLVLTNRKHLKYLAPAAAVGVALSLSSLPYSLGHVGQIEQDAAEIGLAVKDWLTVGIGLCGVGLFIWTGRKIGGAEGVFIAVGGSVTAMMQALTVPASATFITVLGRSILWMWMFAFLVMVWATPLLFNRVTAGLKTSHLQFFGGALAVSIFVFLSVSWSLRFFSVMPLYTTVSQDAVAAINWLNRNTTPDEIVGVYPLSLAFHVSGIGNRPVVTSYLQDGETELNKEAVRGPVLRKQRAVSCSLGLVDNCTEYASDLGARYLITREVAEHPKAFSSGDVYIYDLGEIK